MLGERLLKKRVVQLLEIPIKKHNYCIYKSNESSLLKIKNLLTPVIFAPYPGNKALTK